MDACRAPVEAPLDAVVDGARARRASPTVRSSAPRWPTAESRLRNVPGGDDTAAMLDCLARARASTIDASGDAGVAVHGSRRARSPAARSTLHARLAGTTSRFVTALAALGPGPYTIDGLPPLRARPMAPLHDALVALGAPASSRDGSSGHLPVTRRTAAATSAADASSICAATSAASTSPR